MQATSALNTALASIILSADQDFSRARAASDAAAQKFPFSAQQRHPHLVGEESGATPKVQRSRGGSMPCAFSTAKGAQDEGVVCEEAVVSESELLE